MTIELEFGQLSIGFGKQKLIRIDWSDGVMANWSDIDQYLKNHFPEIRKKEKKKYNILSVIQLLLELLCFFLLLIAFNAVAMDNGNFCG